MLRSGSPELAIVARQSGAAPPDGAATGPDSAQHFLERQRMIEQREPNEHELDQQLLLPTLPETRLEIAERVEHAQHVAGVEPVRVGAKTLGRGR